MIADIENKMNEFWIKRRQTYRDLVNNEALVTENDAIQMICREFMWWCVNDLDLPNKDEYTDYIFSTEGLEAISKFYRGKIMPGPAWKADPATDKQMSYINFLCYKCKKSLNSRKDMTKSQASQIISYLQGVQAGNNPDTNPAVDLFLKK